MHQQHSPHHEEGLEVGSSVEGRKEEGKGEEGGGKEGRKEEGGEESKVGRRGGGKTQAKPYV